MGIERTGRRAFNCGLVALQATFIALTAGCASPVDDVHASAPAGAANAQAVGDDPCRFATADAVGKAFGRPMKSSKLVNACKYLGDGGEMVVVKVAAGPEGTILRHVKTALAQGHKGPEKVTSAVGEAYFDSILPVFIGRVGNNDVQVETTIEPVPRDALIAVGTAILKTLAGK